MGITQGHTRAGDQLVSYDFSDIIVGEVYKIYYGGWAGAYFLASTPTGSDTTRYDAPGILTASAGFTSTTMEQRIDLSFPITINKPVIMQGRAIVVYTVGSVSVDGASEGRNIGSASLLVNSVEICAGQSGTGHQAGVSNTPDSDVKAISMTVPETHLVIGDVLTLRQEIWGKRTSGTQTLTLSLAHDPANKAEDTTDATKKTITDGDPTELKLYLPFRTQQ